MQVEFNRSWQYLGECIRRRLLILPSSSYVHVCLSIGCFDVLIVRIGRYTCQLAVLGFGIWWMTGREVE